MDDYDSILGPSDTSPNIHPQVASGMDDFRNEIAKYATPKPTAPAPAPTLTPQANSIIPESKDTNSTDYKLSNMSGLIGGLGSGVYNAGKGLLNLGKDATVDTFNTINHPIDSIGKGYNYLKNEVVNQGVGNENTDSVGKLIQSTLGSKGALGVGQQLGNAFTDTTGQTDGSFSGSKLAGDTVNSVLTAITGGMGGKTLTAPLLESSVASLVSKGAISQNLADAAIKYGTGLIGKSLESGTVGAGFQAGSNLQEGNPITQNIGKSFATGFAVPPVIEGAGATISKASDITKSVATKFNSADPNLNVNDLAGKIVQGDKSDQANAANSLSNLDVSKVKSYEDLSSVLDTKINGLKTALDGHLLNDKTVTPLSELSTKMTIPKESSPTGQAIDVPHNFVKDALTQLETFYAKTNKPLGEAKIQALTQKAETEGLSIKEINDLARVHGKVLNAFNANGELASGLNKIAAESTREGLKTTARDLFDNPLFQKTDEQISNLIRVKDLVDNVKENVTTLQQKINERGLGANVGVALGKAINLLGLGTPKGIMEALLPRGQGFKVMNALDLEKSLQSNLKNLQNAMKGKNDAEIISNLNKLN